MMLYQFRTLTLYDSILGKELSGVIFGKKMILCSLKFSVINLMKQPQHAGSNCLSNLNVIYTLFQKSGDNLICETFCCGEY